MKSLPEIWRESDRNMSSALRSWRPLLRQMDDMFNEFFDTGTGVGDTSVSFSPTCDVEEQENHYVLSFDLPGVPKDKIDIELQGNRLIVSGERKAEKEKHEGRSHFAERHYGKFQRMLTLPEGINASEIEADYADGVLSVVVPKSQETKPSKIKIGESKGGFLKGILGSRDEKKSEQDKSKTVDVKAS